MRVELDLRRVAGPLASPGIATGIGSASNFSDSGETNLSQFTGSSPLYFDNAFSAANAVSVSTCGGPAESLPGKSQSVTAWVPFSIYGRVTTLPLTLPFPQVFRYSFPADFGTWQVDNLSAPGG